MDNNQYQRNWRRANPERVTAINRKYKYGLSQEEYDILYRKQGGKCAICLLDFDETDINTRPYVDHCHLTKKVRGLVCLRCNSGLGQFSDDFVLLIRAANYLQLND